MSDDYDDENAPFLAEDFAFTAELLRRHMKADRRDLFQAVCSNNINIILAALDAASKEP